MKAMLLNRLKAFALVVAQLPRLTQSLSTLGSVPTSMPFAPVYAMQLANGYMNVALPSNLARMAVTPSSASLGSAPLSLETALAVTSLSSVAYPASAAEMASPPPAGWNISSPASFKLIT